MAEMVLEVEVPAMDVDATRRRILQIFRGNIETELKDRSPVDEGTLRKRWWSEIHDERDEIEFSNNTSYLPWIIRGTGIYGPFHEMIRPKVKKALAWKSTILAYSSTAAGGLMVRRAVRGMKPNPFVQEAVQAGVDRSMADLQAMLGSEPL